MNGMAEPPSGRYRPAWLLIVLLLSSMAVAARYEWRDDAGNVYYGANPPEGAHARRIRESHSVRQRNSSAERDNRRLLECGRALTDIRAGLRRGLETLHKLGIGERAREHLSRRTRHYLQGLSQSACMQHGDPTLRVARCVRNADRFVLRCVPSC